MTCFWKSLLLVDNLLVTALNKHIFILGQWILFQMNLCCCIWETCGMIRSKENLNEKLPLPSLTQNQWSEWPWWIKICLISLVEENVWGKQLGCHWWLIRILHTFKLLPPRSPRASCPNLSSKEDPLSQGQTKGWWIDHPLIFFMYLWEAVSLEQEVFSNYLIEQDEFCNPKRCYFASICFSSKLTIKRFYLKISEPSLNHMLHLCLGKYTNPFLLQISFDMWFPKVFCWIYPSKWILNTILWFC